MKGLLTWENEEAINHLIEWKNAVLIDYWVSWENEGAINHLIEWKKNA